MPIGAAMLGEKACGYFEFGTGDIRMGTVRLTEKTTKDTDFLFAFASGEPTEIGKKDDKDSRTDPKAIELIFRFTKIESLDVLIGVLKEHKEILQKEKEVKS
jgi:hypothetical protein